MDAALKFLNILQVLDRHGVDFILVGGVAAILEGAPVSTLDLDVVALPTGADEKGIHEGRLSPHAIHDIWRNLRFFPISCPALL